MTIQVRLVSTSDYVHNKDYDWSEDVNGKEEHHLGFVCPHDCIKIEAGEVWCPDCEGSGQGLTPEDVERAYAARESGEMDDEA